MEPSKEELQSLKELGLEGAGDNTAFPLGVKVVEINGNNMLHPLSSSEYIEIVKKETGELLNEEDLKNRKCYWGNMACINTGCSRPNRCIRVWRGGEYYVCICGR